MTENVNQAPALSETAPASDVPGVPPTPGSPPACPGGILPRILDLVLVLGARALALVPRRLRTLGVVGPQRRIVLPLIFWVMERRLDGDKAQGLEVVVRWEIADRKGQRVERWQVAIRDGSARVSRTLDAEPSLTLKLDGPTFLDMASGLASAPALFMAGQVVLEGDLMLAARLQSLFRVPGR